MSFAREHVELVEAVNALKVQLERPMLPTQLWAPAHKAARDEDKRSLSAQSVKGSW